jgi:hypothetical protein
MQTSAAGFDPVGVTSIRGKGGVPRAVHLAVPDCGRRIIRKSGGVLFWPRR